MTSLVRGYFFYLTKVIVVGMGQASGIKISDVTYQNIHGTSATKVAVKFDCSPTNPCNRIKLEHVKLSYMNQIAQATCNNVGGIATGLVQPTSCF